MSKFCGKCGSPLDDNGKCPKCDYSSEPQKSSETVNDIPSQHEEKIQNVSEAPAELSKKERRKVKKAEKKRIKKEKKKAKRANWSVGKKIRHFLFKWIAILLVIAILIGAGVGTLVYFGIADIPFISEALDFVGLSENDESDNDNFSVISGRFTDIKITDEKSAVKAVQDASSKLGLENATDELILKNYNKVGNLNYYRLQQNYKGIPVYGKTIVVVADNNGSAQGITSNLIDISNNIAIKSNTNQNQINDSIAKYLYKKDLIDNKESLFVESFGTNNAYVYVDESTAELSYYLGVAFPGHQYHILIGANTHTIFYCNDNVINENVRANGITNANKDVSFNTYKDETGKYWLEDIEHNFVIYSANNETLKSKICLTNDNGYVFYYDCSTQNYVDSEENIINDIAPIIETARFTGWNFSTNEKIKGITKPSNKTTKWNDTKQVSIMYSLETVYNFYEELFNLIGFDNLGTTLSVVYDNNLGGDVTNAYSYSPLKGASMLSFGTNNSLSIDAIAHEYTHSVEHNISNMIYEGESGAIMEAYSDIFGEFIEDYENDLHLDGIGCNWASSFGRSFINPTQDNNPDKYKGKYFGNTSSSYDHGYVHQNSTIISHLAYIMYSTGKITSNDLASLFYNTLYTLQSDCTFIKLRESMEMTAKSLGYSKEKQELISSAFDEVGICYDGEYSLNTTVSVVDNDGENYDNYTIIIDGKKYTGWFKWGWFKNDFHDEIKVTNSNPYTLNLEKGDYNITIKDNDTGEMSKTVSIQARKKAKNNNLKFVTYFGQKSLNSNYSPVITQYQDAIGNDYYADVLNGYADDDIIGEYVNYELLDCARNYDEFHTYYALIDINNDGIEECVIGAGENQSSIGNYDIFSYDGSVPKPLFEVGTFGYRTNFSISEDGIIRTFGSGGAMSNGYAYYRLPKQQVDVEIIDNIFLDFGLYYRSINGNQFEISEEEYNNVVDKYEKLNSAKLNWIEIVKEETDENSKRATSSEREIVLVLDVSGSMSGKPLEETKKASNKFVDTILKEDACIGVVTYDNSANMDSDFSMNETSLKRTVSNIDGGGGTNIESGLQMATDMLESSNAKKKIIVLMSDGEPNDGKTGDELISYADEIKKNDIYIYTLGFFEELGSYKSSAQELMEKLASDGCHYEVSNADDLVFFFGDIADQISGQKYIYVRIACPVDVTVTQNGQTLCSEEDNLSTRTDFGSLTFEENKNTSDSDKDNRIKILRLKDGTDYDVRIEGNGRGRMNYTIGFMDDNGEYSDLRKFTNIKISKSTVIDTVAKDSSSSVLKVDEDGDGKYDLTYKAKANSHGELVDYTYLYYVCGGVVVLILFLVFAVKIKKTKK